MPFATGSAMVPILRPDEPAEVVVKLERKLVGKFDVSLIPNAALLAADAKVTEVSHTQTSVTVRVTVENGLAGAGAVFVICG